VSICSEGHIENSVHFFQCVDSLLKVLSTAAFLGIFTLADEISVPDQRHARDNSGDVSLRDQLVSIEVVDLEDQKNFLFHR